MSESTPRRSARRRSERTEQLYNARMLPDADDSAPYEPQSASTTADRAASRRQAYEQRLREPAQEAALPVQRVSPRTFDESLYTPNEPEPSPFARPEQEKPDAAKPQQEAEAAMDDAPTRIYTAAQRAGAYAAYAKQPESSPAPQQEPEPPQEEAATAFPPSADRSSLAANLSAYYRRAANVSQQQEDDPFTPLDWPPQAGDPAEEAAPEDEPAPQMNIYRPLEASWAQEERQSMLSGEEAGGYQVQTETRQKTGKRRRKKRITRWLITAGVILALLGAAVYLYISHQPEQPVETSAAVTAAVTATPQPVRGYDAAPAMAVSHSAAEAIDQISGPVEMATCAVTERNILARSMRADGLYDFYLFDNEGRLLGYFDGLAQDGMHPMEGGGFYVDMPPYLVDAEGKALLSVAGLEETTGHTMALRPLHNGWARIFADDGDSNLISPEGQLLSRLWFCRSFALTGKETVAYVDTGVEGSESRYTLYVISGEGDGSTVKWLDAADDQGVVTAALGMAYMQSGEVYLLSQLLEGAEAQPLHSTDEIRFYADCGAVVLRDPASGKYALYVNGVQHYDFVYDSILPVESDVRWQGETLGGEGGSAAVFTATGDAYPRPLSYYFALSRDGAEEYVALSAVSDCPIYVD